MFRRALIIPLASLALSAVLSSPFTAAAAQDARDFDIVNQSTASIDAVYVAPSASTSWGSNILSAQVRPGQTLQVRFGDFAPGLCTYDLYTSYTDGSTGTLNELNLCTTMRVLVDDTHIWAE